MFSLDFIACFLLVVLCLVAIPTEVSASSHQWLAMFYHTLTQVVSPSVIKILNIGATDLEVPGRHSLCTDILSSFCVDG